MFGLSFTFSFFLSFSAFNKNFHHLLAQLLSQSCRTFSMPVTFPVFPLPVAADSSFFFSLSFLADPKMFSGLDRLLLAGDLEKYAMLFYSFTFTICRLFTLRFLLLHNVHHG